MDKVSVKLLQNSNISGKLFTKCRKVDQRALKLSHDTLMLSIVL